MNKKILYISLAALLIAVTAYVVVTRKPIVSTDPEAAVRAVVLEFGTKLNTVSLMAPAEQVITAIRQNYGPYISEGLMTGFTQNPMLAPGRMTSSPWPDRIEIRAVELQEDGAYDVQGMVIEVTSADPEKTASSYPIALKLRLQDSRWVITGFSKQLPS